MPSAVSYVEARSAPALAPFVRAYWCTAGRAVGGDTLRVLPDGCADVVFDLARGRATVVGTMTRPLEVPRSGDVDAFGIRFVPGGLHALAHLSLHPFTDAAAPLADADPLGLASLAEELAGASFDGGAVRSRIGRSSLRCAREVQTPPLGPLLESLARAPELPRVATLAAVTGVAERTLERRFQDAVGVGPKAFLRWLRFDRARAMLRTGRTAGEVAAVLYADQPHLVREFRRFCGEPPGAWLSRATRSARGVPPLRLVAPGATGSRMSDSFKTQP